MQTRFKIVEKQNEAYRIQISEGQKDTEDLVSILKIKSNNKIPYFYFELFILSD